MSLHQFAEPIERLLRAVVGLCRPRRMPLYQFVEPIESVGGDFKAYRMDSTKEETDMRKAAGLGTCECCDYVTVSNNEESVIFIEETDLNKTIKALKKKYNYLKDDDQVDLFRYNVLRENRLKLYGSMLVLCRLSCSQVLPNKFQFWLVTTSTAPSNYPVLDNLRDFLKSPLTKEVVDKVCIISSTELAEKLSAQAIEID